VIHASAAAEAAVATSSHMGTRRTTAPTAKRRILTTPLSPTMMRPPINDSSSHAASPTSGRIQQERASLASADYGRSLHIELTPPASTVQQTMESTTPVEWREAQLQLGMNDTIGRMGIIEVSDGEEQMSQESITTETYEPREEDDMEMQQDLAARENLELVQIGESERITIRRGSTMVHEGGLMEYDRQSMDRMSQFKFQEGWEDLTEGLGGGPRSPRYGYNQNDGYSQTVTVGAHVHPSEIGPMQVQYPFNPDGADNDATIDSNAEVNSDSTATTISYSEMGRQIMKEWRNAAYGQHTP